MNYCKVCGCYIPVDASGCLACASKNGYSATAGKEHTVTGIQENEASRQAEKRRAEMRAAFEDHKKAAENRKAGR